MYDKNTTNPPNALAATSSAEGFRTLFDLLPEMVFVADEESEQLIDCNQAALDKLGYQREELIGQPHTIIHPPENKALVAEGFRQRTPAKGDFIAEVVTKNGERISVQITDSCAMVDGKKIRLAIFSDKTRLLRAEQRLAKREKQYRQLVQHSADLITISSEDMKLLWVSDNVKSMMGFDKAEVMQTSFLDKLHPHDLPWVSTYALEKMESAEKEFEYTARFLHKSGHYKWLKNHSIRQEEPDGQVIWLNYSRDITAEKQLQEKKEEIARLKSDFASMASHQLRTPMSVFATNLELLENIQDLKSPLGQRAMNRMRTESDRMIALVDDVLLVSKLHAEQGLSADRQPLELTEELQDILAALPPEASERPPVLKVEVESAPVQADSKQLQHLIGNIIGNAYKYSVGKPAPEICIHKDDKEQVQLSVKDFGIGIPREDLPHLFEQFRRASNANGIVGTGLGLYIARRFAELNQIDISVESQEKMGTTFTLTFQS